MIYDDGFALQLLAAIERMWIKKKYFAMKSLTGWKRNGDKYGSNKPQLHLEGLVVSLRVKKNEDWRRSVKASTSGLNLRQWDLAHFLSTSNSLLDRRTQCILLSVSLSN